MRFCRALVPIMFFTAGLYAVDVPEVYKAKCQACHAVDGSGNTPMGKKLNARDFKLPEVQKETDAELMAITKKGKNKMPGFEGKVTATQLKELVGYIRGLVDSKKK